ncbi:MAG: hypothetical protein PHC61_07375 [Chitinivibrionales bacterium]|nr:hypothetical protein [Chitinivibrionales bacterium]
MKLFTIKLSAFLLVFIILSAGIGSVCYLYPRAILKKKLLIDKSKSILILGDSNTECALNDSIIGKSINISKSAEKYIYSYAKLRTILQCNPCLKTVIIGYSFLNLDNSQDGTMFSDYYLHEGLLRYNLLLNAQEIFLLFSKNPACVIKTIPEIFNRNLDILRLPKTPRIQEFRFGGYFRLVRDKPVDISKEADTATNKECKLSPYQCGYLIKISNLCREKSVKLILLNTPKHPSFIRKLNLNLCKYYYDFYKNSLSSNMLMDHSQFFIPDSGFGDGIHLNWKGAKLYSTKIKDILYHNGSLP